MAHHNSNTHTCTHHHVKHTHTHTHTQTQGQTFLKHSTHSTHTHYLSQNIAHTAHVRTHYFSWKASNLLRHTRMGLPTKKRLLAVSSNNRNVSSNLYKKKLQQ